MEIFYTVILAIVPLLVYLLQIALTFVLALVLSIIPYILIKKSANHAYVISLILSVLLVFGSVYYITYNPIIIATEAQQTVITEEIRSEILDESTGLYSEKLPIFPIYIKINSANSKVVRYSTKYLYFGIVETEITIGEGVSSELVLY
ncbi:MAG: hypothetical protein R3Y09_00295 [Clostridia bacterium]